jgi:hypothetical protein
MYAQLGASQNAPLSQPAVKITVLPVRRWQSAGAYPSRRARWNGKAGKPRSHVRELRDGRCLSSTAVFPGPLRQASVLCTLSVYYVGGRNRWREREATPSHAGTGQSAASTGRWMGRAVAGGQIWLDVQHWLDISSDIDLPAVGTETSMVSFRQACHRHVSGECNGVHPVTDRCRC